MLGKLYASTHMGLGHMGFIIGFFYRVRIPETFQVLLIFGGSNGGIAPMSLELQVSMDGCSLLTLST